MGAIVHTSCDLSALNAWFFHTTSGTDLQQNQQYQSFPELHHPLPVLSSPFPMIPGSQADLYSLLRHLPFVVPADPFPVQEPFATH